MSWAGRTITSCTAIEAADGTLTRVLLGVDGRGHHALGASPHARHADAGTPWRVIVDPDQGGPAAATALTVLRPGLTLETADAVDPERLRLATEAGTLLVTTRKGSGTFMFTPAPMNAELLAGASR